MARSVESVIRSIITHLNSNFNETFKDIKLIYNNQNYLWNSSIDNELIVFNPLSSQIGFTTYSNDKNSNSNFIESYKGVSIDIHFKVDKEDIVDSFIACLYEPITQDFFLTEGIRLETIENQGISYFDPNFDNTRIYILSIKIYYINSIEMQSENTFKSGSVNIYSNKT